MNIQTGASEKRAQGLVGLVGALGLAPVVMKLWGISTGVLIATLLSLAMTLRPEQVVLWTARSNEAPNSQKVRARCSNDQAIGDA